MYASPQVKALSSKLSDTTLGLTDVRLMLRGLTRYCVTS